MSARSRRDLWAAFYREGRLLGVTGDLNGALENETKALELIEGLAAADPADKGHRRWLALTYFSVGQTLAQLGRGPEALERYRKAIEISEALFRDDPGRVEAERDLARMHEALGLLFIEMKETDHALESLKRASPWRKAAPPTILITPGSEIGSPEFARKPATCISTWPTATILIAQQIDGKRLLALPPKFRALDIAKKQRHAERSRRRPARSTAGKDCPMRQSLR